MTISEPTREATAAHLGASAPRRLQAAGAGDGGDPDLGAVRPCHVHAFTLVPGD